MLTPLSFCVITIIILLFTWKQLNQEAKIPFITYIGAYTATTMIGGIFLGLVNNQYAIGVLKRFSINTFTLPVNFDLGYWILLFCPVIVPALVLVMIKRVFSKLITLKINWLNQSVSLVAFWYVFLIFLLYYLFKMYSIFSTGAIFNLIKNIDYQSTILFRRDLIARLGSIFYGLSYSTIPTFSYVALFQWSKTRSIAWKLTFLFSLLVTSLIYLSIVMKAILLIYLISIIFGLYFLKIIKSFNFLLIIGGMVLLVIYSYESFVLQEWYFLETIDLILFRLASSFPFYYMLFPKILPYTGIYIPLLTPTPNDNNVVFSYMYPQIDWTVGSVVGSAPLMAYSQAGLTYAIFVMILIGFFIFLVSQIGKKIRGPLMFSLYLNAIVFLYYLTQISLQSALVSAYGIIGGFLGIGILFIISLLFRSANLTRINGSYH